MNAHCVDEVDDDIRLLGADVEVFTVEETQEADAGEDPVDAGDDVAGGDVACVAHDLRSMATGRRVGGEDFAARSEDGTRDCRVARTEDGGFLCREGYAQR